MTVTPDQEMAYRITELYLKHILNSKDRKDLSIDDVLDKYHYTLDQIKSKQQGFSEEVIQQNMALLPGLPAANELLFKQDYTEEKKSEIEPSTKDPKRINELALDDDEEIPSASQFI